MARLPGAEALGERPTPTLPRRTPLVADYRPTSGFEETSAQVLGHSASELQQAAGIAIQMQDQHDALRAEDAFNKLRVKQMDMTVGKDGFANLKGGNAVNRPLLKEYGGAFDGAAAELAGGLDNDYQRQLFQRRAEVLGLGLRSDLMKHVAHESDVYADTVFKSSMDVNAKAAGVRWSMPDAAIEPLLHMDNVIQRQAERLGTGPEWVDEMKAKARSSVYTSMVKAALASDPLKGPFAAESILKIHGNEIDPASHFILSHEVKAAIRPIEVGAIAQDSVNEVLTGVVAAMSVGGEGAVNKVVSDTAGDTTFRFRKPDGTITEGTARSEQAAKAYGERVLGIPADGNVGATNVDVNALVGDAIGKAEAKAAAMRPGDTQFRDEVVAKTKNYIATIAAAKESGQVQAVNGLISIINPTDGKGPQTKAELMANPQARGMYLALTPKQQLGIDEALHANVKRVLGETGVDKTEVLFDLARRTQLPVGDPNRIRTDAQLVEYLAPGKGLTMAGYNFLRSLAERSNLIDGQSEGKYLHYITQRGAQMLADSTQGRLLVIGEQKDKLDAAQNQFAFDTMRTIDQYKKEGKPLDPLFDPKSSEYLLNPSQLFGKYLPAASASVANAANAALPKPAQLTKDNADAEYEALPPGAPFLSPDGKPGRKPGVYQPPVQAAPAATVAAPAPAVKAKSDVPVFVSNRGMDPQDQENHLGGLWAAAKAVAGTAIQMAPVNLTVQGLRELVGKIGSMKETQQEDVAKGMWKFLLQSGQFTPDDVPVIEAALKYGNLDPGDIARAKAMLKAAGR